jgi:hypothetical protein
MNGGVKDSSQKADFSVSKPFYNAAIMASLEQAKELALAVSRSRRMPVR